MAFTNNNNNLVSMDSMQFMNSSLNALDKNVSDNDLNIYQKNLVVICYN